MKYIKRFFAVLLIITISLISVGCGDKTKTSTDGDTVALKWYITIPEQEGISAVFEKANEYIKEKINATVEFVPIDFGNYETKLQVINAGREEYDLAFVSNWLNNYYQNINKGALIPLDELISQYAPNTYKNIPEKYWEGVKVDGKIYGVINQQIMARGPCLQVPKKNLKLLNFDKSKLTSYEGIEEYLKAAYEYSGKFTYMGSIWSSYIGGVAGMEEIVGANIPGAIYLNAKDNIKVFNQFESQEFKDAIKYRRNLFLKGYTEPDMNTPYNSEAFNATEKPEDLIPCIGVQPTYKPGIEGDILTTMFMDVDIFMRQKAYATTSAATSTMTGISSTSKNPERAMQLIELVNNDKYLYNLLSFGIEGVNFKKLDDNTIEVPKDGYFLSQNWSFGNVYNSYLTPTQPKDTWEQTAKINEEAEVSPMMGFSPDLTNIKAEIANCNSAVNEFLKPLDFGLVDVDTQYNKFLSKLKLGGCDKIISEIQLQVDEFIKNKNK